MAEHNAAVAKAEAERVNRQIAKLQKRLEWKLRKEAA
jgi:hypothetical protein